LAAALSTIYREFYPDGAAKSDSFGRLVNEASSQRVNKALKGSNGKVALGGASEGVFMEPTILTDVKGDDAIMQDELFAPILSIVPVETFDEAIAFVNDRFVTLFSIIPTSDIPRTQASATRSLCLHSGFKAQRKE